MWWALFYNKMTANKYRSKSMDAKTAGLENDKKTDQS